MKRKYLIQLFNKKVVHFYLLGFILILAIFLRFYNTPARYGFDFDPTRDALISIYGATNFKFPLSGPQSGIAPFTFGPWYYYQIIFAKIILPFGYAPWIYIGITSVITVFVMYKIGELLESKSLGLIIALLTALSPAELGPITGLSNPNLVPIQAALSIYLFLYLIKKRQTVFIALLWGICLGIGINNHYQMLGLLVLPFLYFFYKRPHLRIVGALFVGLAVTFIPLLLFNLKTDWATLEGILFYFTHKSSVYIPNRWLTYVFDYWPQFFSYVIGIPKILGYIVLFYAFFITCFVIAKKKGAKIYLLLFFGFLMNFLILRYYSGQRENYYVIYLHPFLTIWFGWLLWQSLKQKWLRYSTVIVCLVISFFVIKEDLRRLQSEQLYLDLQKQTQQLLTDFPNQKFTILNCGKIGKNRVQAIAFFLSNKNKLAKNGVPIGFVNQDCKSTYTKYTNSHTIKGIVIFKKNTFPKDTYWTNINPETVYNETLRE